MSTMQVTAHIPLEEGQKIDEEAQALGTSRTDYVKQIILQRLGKVVQIANSDAAVIQARMEGKIEVLMEQNDKLQRDLASASEKSGLNGVETKNVSVSKQIEEALAKKDADIKLKGLEEEVKELTAELAEVEKERDEYKLEVEKNTRMERMMQQGTQMLEVAGRVAPKPIERIMNGLAGLLGGGEMGNGEMGSLNEEQTLALNAGTAIMQDIQVENRMTVIDLLKYMATTPGAINAFAGSKGFKTWQSVQH